jgi:hypothetical protein
MTLFQGSFGAIPPEYGSYIERNRTRRKETPVRLGYAAEARAPLSYEII